MSPGTTTDGGDIVINLIDILLPFTFSFPRWSSWRVNPISTPVRVWTAQPSVPLCNAHARKEWFEIRRIHYRDYVLG